MPKIFGVTYMFSRLAHYHRSCYRQYINISSASGELSTEQDENTIDESYANAEGVALAKLFDYYKK